MKTILIATSNPHKLKEIQHILRSPVEGCGLKIAETGKTFEENATKKAKAVAKKYKCIAIADDSGLMVDCLKGKPGVRSARYASPPTPPNLCRKLLRAMKNCKNRRAKFVCVIALAYPKGKTRTYRGEVKGKIIEEMRGRHGFGYDPVFVPDGHKKTFAEMAPAAKNRISHRSLALTKLKRAREDSNLQPTD